MLAASSSLHDPIAAHRGNLFLADTGVHQIGDEGAGVHPLGSGYRSGPNRLTWCRHRKWETINPISTLLQRFACARLSQPCLPESCPDFSPTFTTIAFDHTS